MAPKVKPKIRVFNAALDERDGQIVLRGVIDADSLPHLQVGPYQREVLSEKKVAELMEAHRDGGVDDIELGMRGSRTEDEDGGSVFYLLDPVFIIDGLQRVTAGIRVMQEDERIHPHIGATIRFDTTEAVERRLFKVFNLNRTRLSPNIVLRNEKDEVPVIQALYRLTHDENFTLHGRVQWGQVARKSELISATTYVKVVGRVHAHLGSGRGSNVLELAAGLDRIMRDIGRPTLVANVEAFFDLIEDCWGISEIEFKEEATVIKVSFLSTLAAVLSDHLDFWDDDKLTVPATLAQKLKRFKVNDPNIRNLAASAGAAADILYDLMVKHINSGKRTRQLRPRGKAGTLSETVGS